MNTIKDIEDALCLVTYQDEYLFFLTSEIPLLALHEAINPHLSQTIVKKNLHIVAFLL